MYKICRAKHQGTILAMFCTLGNVMIHNDEARKRLFRQALLGTGCPGAEAGKTTSSSASSTGSCDSSMTLQLVAHDGAPSTKPPAAEPEQPAQQPARDSSAMTDLVAMLRGNSALRRRLKAAARK